MKKTLFYVSLFAFSFSFLSAQTFQRGSLIISADYGFDVYSVKEHQVNTYTVPNESQEVTNGAASGNINFGGEFGVTKWLGLGVQLKFDTYLHHDTGKSGIQSAYGFEGGIIINAHILRHEHFDLLAGLNLGASSLTITWNDGFNDQIYGSGSWTDIHFTARVYIKRFGFSGTLYFPFINYTNLTSNNSTFNEYYLISWKANGTGINFGIQYHFLR